MAVIIWTALERLIYVTFITITIMGGLRYFINARELEIKTQQKVMYGLSSFLVILGISRYFYFYGAYYRPGEYEGTSYIGSYELTPTVEFLEMIGHFVSVLSLLAFIIFLESIKEDRKKYLSLISVISTATAMAVYLFSVALSTYLFGILLVIFLVLFLSILKAPDQKLQNLSLFILTGFSIYSIGVGLSMPVAISMGLYPIELVPICFLVGAFFLIIPAFIDIERIINKKPQYLWMAFIILQILVILLTFYFLFLTQSAYYVLGIPLMILMNLFMIRGYLRIVKNSRSIHPADGDLDSPEIIAAFTRPKKISEEEISVSQEKKICLVCKNPAIGMTFVCTECATFYCNKCYVVLIQMENACWACFSALDETKPVKLEKPIEKEEQTVEISHKKPKKGK